MVLVFDADARRYTLSASSQDVAFGVTLVSPSHLRVSWPAPHGLNPRCKFVALLVTISSGMID
jgi:hypothetical protein